MESIKATRKEILVFYEFRPYMKVWISHMLGQSYSLKIPEETWYDGNWFNSGYFAFIQCKLFAIHIKMMWWKLRQ